MQANRSTSESPVAVHTNVKIRLAEKTEEVLQIIKHCESLRGSYHNPQHEWMHSIETEYEGIESVHRDLENERRRHRLLILRPGDQRMITRVLPNYFKQIKLAQTPQAT
jgi:hypothetical protein